MSLQRYESVPLRSVPSRLDGVVTSELGNLPGAPDLVTLFLLHSGYDRTFVAGLFECAKDESASWEMRSLAVLMLENRFLRIPTHDSEEYSWFLDQLGLTQSDQGVSPAELNRQRRGDVREAFELRCRLARLDRIHSQINGRRTSATALHDFIDTSRRSCKLTLARYLFNPNQVVERVGTQVSTSRGVQDRFPATHPYMNGEARRALAALPDYERGVIQGLAASSRIYWVSETTSSELNSLVEYPVGTVVLVVKPPGSDIEIELKRAGCRGDRPLTVVFESGGEDVPPSHRLYGGSMGSLLRWDAGTAALLSRLYRAIHDKEAPVARTMSIATVYGVPTSRGEQHVLRYFTESGVFGIDGFTRMRKSIKKSIAAFNGESWFGAPPAPGDIGLTSQFLSQVAPSQAILLGTTSFRLDRIALYLSAQGPAEYFKALGRRITRLEARRLAGEVLEEVLGVFVPPEARYESHRQYVRAALRVTSNRKRADAAFLSLMLQIGRFWGTLVGLRGYSNGESFAARNVGLRSVWEDAAWRVKIIFMDHDGLNLIGKQAHSFHPLNSIGGMVLDHIHIFGKRGNKRLKGEVGLLEEIYQVSESIRRKGRSLLRRATREAYVKTISAIASNPEAQACFQPSFVNRIRDWDEIVTCYLKTSSEAQSMIRWKSRTRRLLIKRGYNKRLIEIHVKAIERNARFLRKHRFLYQSVAG